MAVGRARQQRAVQLRDMALAVLRVRGTWRPAATNMPISALAFEGDGLSLLHTTPFQRLPPMVSERGKYLAALYGRPPPKDLPYKLDVSSDGKKLNIEWDDDGQVLVVSYRPGEWEATLERLAHSSV